MDYARKIAAAETEGEADVLTRERDDKLASLDFEEMKKGMDWDKILVNWSVCLLIRWKVSERS